MDSNYNPPKYLKTSKQATGSAKTRRRSFEKKITKSARVPFRQIENQENEDKIIQEIMEERSHTVKQRAPYNVPNWNKVSFFFVWS